MEFTPDSHQKSRAVAACLRYTFFNTIQIVLDQEFLSATGEERRALLRTVIDIFHGGDLDS